METSGGDLTTYELDELLAEMLDQAFHKQTAEVCLDNLSKIALDYSPIDLARAASTLPPSVRPVLFQKFDDLEKKIQFLINTDSSTRTSIFRYITDHETKEILEKTPPDEAVYMLEDVSEKRFRRLMDLIHPEKAGRIRALKKHNRNSAGRLMTNEFFAFPKDLTLGEVAQRIRNNSGVEFTRRIFITDASGYLEGYIPARTLIVNPPHVRLRDVWLPAEYKVTPEASREEVIELVERYKISGLPVVDDNNLLVGVITYEDVVEAMEDIADETIAAMAGTGERVSEVEPFFTRFIARAPWLFVTLFAGLLNMCVMSYFQKYELGLLPFIFFFVPLITGMSGNIGLQCSTILVRNLALGLLNTTNRRDFIFKELLLGLFTGGFFGVLSGALVYLLHSQGVHVTSIHPLIVGTIISLGLFGSCIAGTVLGVFSPLFFSRIGVDPAVSSGPIITAMNDCLSMTIYFFISIGLMSLLLN